MARTRFRRAQTDHAFIARSLLVVAAVLLALAARSGSWLEVRFASSDPALERAVEVASAAQGITDDYLRFGLGHGERCQVRARGVAVCEPMHGCMVGYPPRIRWAARFAWAACLLGGLVAVGVLVTFKAVLQRLDATRMVAGMAVFAFGAVPGLAFLMLSVSSLLADASSIEPPLVTAVALGPGAYCYAAGLALPVLALRALRTHRSVVTAATIPQAVASLP